MTAIRMCRESSRCPGDRHTTPRRAARRPLTKGATARVRQAAPGNRRYPFDPPGNRLQVAACLTRSWHGSTGPSEPAPAAPFAKKAPRGTIRCLRSRGVAAPYRPVEPCHDGERHSGVVQAIALRRSPRAVDRRVNITDYRENSSRPARPQVRQPNPDEWPPPNRGQRTAGPVPARRSNPARPKSAPV